MAFTGLAKPYVATATVAEDGTITYSNGATVGAAVACTITPQYSEGSLYGDNSLQEHDYAFTSADISLETTYIPQAMQNVLLGHTVSTTENTVTYNINDNPGYCGLGFYVHEIFEGTQKCVAIFLPKVKFSEGEDSFNTKGENLEYATPTLSGSATSDKDGQWKQTKTFTKSESQTAEAQAEAWIKEKLSIA